MQSSGPSFRRGHRSDRRPRGPNGVGALGAIGALAATAVSTGRNVVIVPIPVIPTPGDTSDSLHSGKGDADELARRGDAEPTVEVAVIAIIGIRETVRCSENARTEGRRAVGTEREIIRHHHAARRRIGVEVVAFIAIVGDRVPGLRRDGNRRRRNRTGIDD